MWQPARFGEEYRRTAWGTRVTRVTATPGTRAVHGSAVGAPFAQVTGVRSRRATGSGPRAGPRGAARRPFRRRRREGRRARPNAPRGGSREARTGALRGASTSPPRARQCPRAGFVGELRFAVSDTAGVPENPCDTGGSGARRPPPPLTGARPHGPLGDRRRRARRAYPWSIPTKWPSSASSSGADSSFSATGRTTSSGGLAFSSASTSAHVRCSCGTHERRWRL